MANTSTWTLTHITFDAEAGTWCLKGERVRPPYENECLYGEGTNLAEAVIDWEAKARGQRHNYTILREPNHRG